MAIASFHVDPKWLRKLLGGGGNDASAPKLTFNIDTSPRKMSDAERLKMTQELREWHRQQAEKNRAEIERRDAEARKRIAENRKHHTQKTAKRWSIEPDSECASYIEYDAESEIMTVEFVKTPGKQYDFPVDPKTAREVKKAARIGIGACGETLNDEVIP